MVEHAFLTDEDLVGLTHKRRRSAQLRALRFMGIEHKVRADNTIAVLWSHVRAEFGAAQGTPMHKEYEPNWGAL